MPGLHLLIKPVSGACNHRCAYCFYADVAANRSVRDRGVMSAATAEALIRSALNEADNVTFGFQGGEPTLWGLDNFRVFAETAEKLNSRGARISYSLQTNGSALDFKWAEFFRERDFLIGLSLDGYGDLHDSNRRDASGRGTFARTIAAAALLRKTRVNFNVLSVVTAKTAANTEKLYAFYKNQNLVYLQFIPCIDGFGAEESGLTPRQYGNFLKTLFDLWYRDRSCGREVSVRFFDNLLGICMGRPPEQCSQRGECGVQFTVEADGSVYPCDFYVLDEWLIGNVHESGFSAMCDTEAARRFVAVSRALSAPCRRCRWYALCRGGCRREREPVAAEGASPNRFCEAFMDFFAHSYDRLHI